MSHRNHQRTLFKRKYSLHLNHLFDVKNKVVLVTGGSRGIGKMICEGFVRNGCKVYLTSRNAKSCQETSESLQKLGHCVSIPFDISKEEEIDKLLETFKQHENRLDILVNNAGANWAAPIDHFPPDGWDKVMDLNVKSVFFVSQKFLPLLRQSGSSENPSRIINIGSVDGIRIPKLDTIAYSTSKAALHQLTRVFAAKVAKDHVTVNAIAAGYFPTKMTKDVITDEVKDSILLSRFGTPEDIVGTCLYLSSRAGSWVTGSILVLDGGSCIYPTL